LLIILRGAGAFVCLKGVASLGGPDEGPGIFLGMFNIIEDSSNQLLDAAKAAAAQPVLGQVAEETLHHDQSEAASWGKVLMKAGLAGQAGARTWDTYASGA